ncbi:MAG: hypothetical protein IJ570_04760 [Prevotella sp.]|nr:hypothetical protein [Prevotella sp.]
MMLYNIKTFLRRWLVGLTVAAGLTGLTALIVYMALDVWVAGDMLWKEFGVYATIWTLVCIWYWWFEWRWE